jgi:hypothetical protein
LSVLIKKISELIKIRGFCEPNGDGSVHGDVLHDPEASIYRLSTDLQKPQFGGAQTKNPSDHVIQMDAV